MEMTKIPSAAHFVFVHGAFHGAWCWYKIRCLLESAGHKVTCIDLRSAGIDPTDANTIFNFGEFNKPLDDVFSCLGEGEKVILVGHSIGGFNVTAALYKCPEKIQAAVYLVAAMVRNNSHDKVNHRMLWAPGYPNGDEIYDYVYGEGPNQPPTSLMIKKQFQRQRFYSRSPLEDITLAGMLLKPAPFRAYKDAKVPNDGKEIDNVPRVFIKTLDDNTITEEAQDDMINQWPPSDVYSIESDHSAFFSAPFELFALLLNVATRYAYGSSSQGIPASKQKIGCGRCKAPTEIEYLVSRSHDKNFMRPSYACINCSSFLDQEDVNANGRVVKARQRRHEIGSQGEQVVTINEVRENNEKAYGGKETREALSRIYDGLKILMLLSVCMIIVLFVILATKA